jgi:hypothetical protein
LFQKHFLLSSSREVSTEFVGLIVVEAGYPTEFVGDISGRTRCGVGFGEIFGGIVISEISSSSLPSMYGFICKNFIIVFQIIVPVIFTFVIIIIEFI